MNDNLNENKIIEDGGINTPTDGTEEKVADKQQVPEENRKIVDDKNLDISQEGGDDTDQVNLLRT